MRPANDPRYQEELLTGLRADWRAWVGIIERCSRRAGHAPHDVYVALHARLLKVCECLGDTECAEAPFFRNLYVMARPWLSPAALESADREILADLLARAQEAGRHLGCWPWWHGLIGMIAPLAATVALVVLIAVAAYVGWLRPVFEWLDDLQRSLVRAGEQAGTYSALAALGVAMFLLMLFLAARAPRS